MQILLLHIPTLFKHMLDLLNLKILHYFVYNVVMISKISYKQRVRATLS